MNKKYDKTEEKNVNIENVQKINDRENEVLYVKKKVCILHV